MKNCRLSLHVFAAIIVFLPAIYMASYVVLVSPGHSFHSIRSGGSVTLVVENYRYGGQYSDWIFSPLERMDRKLRPDAWE